MYIIFDKDTVINLDNITTFQIGAEGHKESIYFHYGGGYTRVKFASEELARHAMAQILDSLWERDEMLRLETGVQG